MRTRNGNRVVRFELRMTVEERQRLRALAEQDAARLCSESDVLRELLLQATVAEGGLAILADTGLPRAPAAVAA